METRKSLMTAILPVGHLIIAAFLTNAALLIPQPFLPTLLLQILCMGGNECSDMIYLYGALQLGVGLTAVLIAPILGGFSDAYGRKPILLLIFASAIIPQVILAFSRTKTAVYMWCLAALITYSIRLGGFVPTLLASVADVVAEERRPEANGFSIGSLSVGFIVGTLASLAISSVDQALMASVILECCATVYLMIFLKETNPRQPLIKPNESQAETAKQLLPKLETKRNFSVHEFRETARIVWSSRRLMTIVLVNFLTTYGKAGVDIFVVFYLIATFDFGQRNLATINLISGVGSALGMTILYPVFTRLLGDRGVLQFSLLANAGQYAVYFFANTSRFPYVAAGMDVFNSITDPAIGTMVSKGVDRERQGKVQGFMGAVQSAATILAPLTITPLAAASLGGSPPFGLRGFPFIIGGSALVLAGLIANALPALPPPEDREVSSEDSLRIQIMPPVESSTTPSQP